MELTKLKPVDKQYGDLMTLTEWKSCVTAGFFIDYHGHGEVIWDGYETGTDVNPSDFESNPDLFKGIKGNLKILWFNR